MYTSVFMVKERLTRAPQKSFRNTEKQYSFPGKELEKFGNTLWRGTPLEVAQPHIISDANSVSFLLKQDNLPFKGDISVNILPHLQVHVRSRYAHLGLDVFYDTGEQLFKAAQEQGMLKEGQQVEVSLPLINHCARPIELPKGAKPFHFFLVPDAAYVRGKELEYMVGKEDDKTIRIRGRKGRDWRLYYETGPTGKKIASALYLKVDPDERYWIPPTNVPIRLNEAGTFEQAREFLFTYLMKRTNDPEFPMPPDGLWIGRGPHLSLKSDVYLKLDHDVFVEKNGAYERVGMQTHSPLLEGLRTNHYPHFELKGQADWARATVVRNSGAPHAG